MRLTLAKRALLYVLAAAIGAAVGAVMSWWHGLLPEPGYYGEGYLFGTPASWAWLFFWALLGLPATGTMLAFAERRSGGRGLVFATALGLLLVVTNVLAAVPLLVGYAVPTALWRRRSGGAGPGPPQGWGHQSR